MRVRDSKRHFCFECGNQFVFIKGVEIFTEQSYHGTLVKLHKDCAKRIKEEHKDEQLQRMRSMNEHSSYVTPRVDAGFCGLGKTDPNKIILREAFAQLADELMAETGGKLP